MFKLAQIDHVALDVRDLKRSLEWYESVLGLERKHQEAWGDIPVVLYAGSTAVALFPAAGEITSCRHLAFRADRSNFHLATEGLERRGIPVQFEDHGISHSIYFHDPDGHVIEITTYEVTKDSPAR